MSYCELLYFAKCAVGPLNQALLRSSLCFEMIYMKRACGSGTLFYDGGEHRIETDDIIILPPDVKYRFECDGECDCIFLGFKGADCGFKDAPFFAKDERLSVAPLFDLMADEFKGHRYHRKVMLNLLLNAALVTICRLSTASDLKKEIETANFSYILHYIDAQSQNGINIDEIAKMSGLSYHRFRHKFKELTGISPQQYIIRQRLNFAKRLLETTTYSTSSIAAACGFHSVPQFITCFNKQEGLTPVKYRKKHKIA